MQSIQLHGTNTGDEVPATTLVQGIIELATQAEVNAGTDTTRAITPSRLKSHLGITATLSTTLNIQWNNRKRNFNFYSSNSLNRQSICTSICI